MRRNLPVTVAFFLVLGATLYYAAAKRPVRNDQETPLEKELGGYLLDKLAGGNGRGGHLGPDAGLADVMDAEKFRELIDKHGLKLLGGPVVGRLGPHSAAIWVRTTRPAEVRVDVHAGDGSLSFDPEQTTPESDMTAVCPVDGLEPFTEYEYNVFVDGEPVYPGAERPRFRTAPAPGQAAQFRVAFGGGARYIPGKEHIWSTIADRNPLAFLFLGDNIYIDRPKRRDVQRAYYYRRQMNPHYRELTSTTGIYAIWDDHDFGRNDSSGGLDPFQPDWKLPVYEVFRQNWVNPYYGGGREQPGCWHHFSLGDVDFIMTDGRYYRDFKQDTMLGPAQKQWIKERLREADGQFVVLASGTLWTEHADKGGRDSWWGVKEERNEIFQTIVEERIPGVILISADRHRTDIYRIDYEGCYPLYEFETSKLTNNHTHGTKERALWSYNKGNFFGEFTFDLAPKDPAVTFRCVTSEGKEVHEMTVKRSELEF